MLSISVFSLSFIVALYSARVFGRQDAVCQNATAVAQDPTCWTALGYNTWFDTWKGPCPGPPGCTCDVRKPWSDCVLNQYQTTLNGPAKLTISCIDLTIPDLCYIPSSDWTKLSENQLATAYASTAIRSKLIPERDTKKVLGVWQEAYIIRFLLFRSWVVHSYHTESSTTSCLRYTFRSNHRSFKR